MDNDFASKLQNILSDPAALAKISSIASSLGSSNPAADTSAEQTAEDVKPAEIPNQLPVSLPQSDPRLALLASVKPLLKQEKQGRVDSLMNALTVAAMLKNFRK